MTAEMPPNITVLCPSSVFRQLLKENAVLSKILIDIIRDKAQRLSTIYTNYTVRLHPKAQRNSVPQSTPLAIWVIFDLV